MATFSGLTIGLSSLYAQQRGMEVTGHNIANVNTDGYSRQRVRLVADGGPMTPAIHARWEGAGNGVNVAGVDRLRDAFLEARSLVEHGTDAALRTVNGILRQVEIGFAEPGETGLQSQMADFFNGWDDVANHPDDLAARTQLLERAETLVTGLNQAAADVSKLWDVSRQQMAAVVDQVNATASRVADLNKAIITAVNSGLSPNDLMDQRDVLVGQLADLVGATARPADDGSVTVSLGGTALVRGDRFERLQVAGATEATQPPATPVTIQWAKDGYPARVTGGQAGGLATAVNDVLPRYRDRLDEVAATLARDVNEIHQGGVDQAGDPGKALFVPVDPASTRITASGIRVGITTPGELAAAPAGSPAGSRDGSNAAALAELAGRAGGGDTLYRALIVDLGIEAQTSGRRVAIQAEMTRQADGARDADSGVNLDEEMTNMITYQRAYEAAARFVSAVDQVLDTLINRTGVVGR